MRGASKSVVQRRHETIMMISKPARALAQVLIMGAAAWLVLEQSRSPAIIFATSLLFGRALAPIEGAIVGWKAFAMALAAYRRLNGIMSAVTPATIRQGSPGPAKGRPRCQQCRRRAARIEPFVPEGRVVLPRAR